MHKVKLSANGQLVVPRQIRDRLGWQKGTELWLEVHPGCVVVRKAPRPPVTKLDDLIGCADYQGPRRSLKDMADAIARGTQATK